MDGKFIKIKCNTNEGDMYKFRHVSRPFQADSSEMVSDWRHDTQHIDIQHNDIQHIGIQHNDIQHNSK